jgi:DNA polymerase-3 subunit beta
MRLSISREKLQEALISVSAAVPAKTTLPVLANLLLETSDRGLRISGTDLDIGVSMEVVADVEAVGSITIPARKLSDIVRELPPAPVRL